MSKRTSKVDDTPVLQTREEVNEALSKIATLSGQIGSAEAEAAEKRRAIDEQQAAVTKPLIAERKALEQQIQHYAEKQKEAGAFDTKRSIELGAGFIGFRRSRKTKFTVRPQSAVVELLEASAAKKSKLGKLLKANLDSLIKTTKKPVATAIKALDLSDEDYERIGVKIVDEDVFAYSTDKSKEFDLTDEDGDAKGKAA